MTYPSPAEAFALSRMTKRFLLACAAMLTCAPALAGGPQNITPPGVTSVDTLTGGVVTEHCDTFSATGAWTKLATATQISVELIGAGGGGGKGGTDPGSSATTGGAGGGAYAAGVGGAGGAGAGGGGGGGGGAGTGGGGPGGAGSPGAAMVCQRVTG